MKLLSAHVESMRSWIDLACEVVVVDSDSTDGTLDYVRAQLPRANVIHHPPGLYESWNRGIREISAPFTYISTVGDAISREGLLHLHDVAVRHAADVVVSPPDFVDESGRCMQGNEWPVHDLITQLRLAEDVCFDGLLLFLVALSYIPFAILGSSASNIYRTAALRERPFPTEYGRNGDGAWGLIHALDIRLAMSPRRVSTFCRHRRWYAPEEYDAPDGDRRMLEAALQRLAAHLGQDAALRREAESLRANALIDAKRTVQAWRGKLHASRKRVVPWIFDPLAWRARLNRDVAQRRCMALLRGLLQAHPPAPSRPAALSRVAV